MRSLTTASTRFAIFTTIPILRSTSTISETARVNRCTFSFPERGTTRAGRVVMDWCTPMGRHSRDISPGHRFPDIRAGYQALVDWVCRFADAAAGWGGVQDHRDSGVDSERTSGLLLTLPRRDLVFSGATGCAGPRTLPRARVPAFASPSDPTTRVTNKRRTRACRLGRAGRPALIHRVVAGPVCGRVWLRWCEGRTTTRISPTCQTGIRQRDKCP